MTATPELSVAYIREQLRLKGAVVLDLANGKKLFLVLSKNLGLDEQGILVAGDGGSLYWTLDRPLNRYRLISAGFTLKVAGPILELINSILTKPNTDPVPRLAESAAHKD